MTTIDLVTNLVIFLILELLAYKCKEKNWIEDNYYWFIQGALLMATLNSVNNWKLYHKILEDYEFIQAITNQYINVN